MTLFFVLKNWQGCLNFKNFVSQLFAISAKSSSDMLFLWVLQILVDKRSDVIGSSKSLVFQFKLFLDIAEKL